VLEAQVGATITFDNYMVKENKNREETNNGQTIFTSDLAMHQETRGEGRSA
jgi:hypothetical protein